MAARWRKRRHSRNSMKRPLSISYFMRRHCKTIDRAQAGIAELPGRIGSGGRRPAEFAARAAGLAPWRSETDAGVEASSAGGDGKNRPATEFIMPRRRRNASPACSFPSCPRGRKRRKRPSACVYNAGPTVVLDMVRSLTPMPWREARRIIIAAISLMLVAELLKTAAFTCGLAEHYAYGDAGAPTERHMPSLP